MPLYMSGRRQPVPRVLSIFQLHCHHQHIKFPLLLGPDFSREGLSPSHQSTATETGKEHSERGSALFSFPQTLLAPGASITP